MMICNKMKDWIKLRGKIVFDVEDKTKKHISQSSWKRTVMFQFGDDLSDYYAWFINKRYNLKLNKPLRGSHYTIVNDKISEMKNWDNVRSKYYGTYGDVYFHPDVRSNGEHWWLKAFSIDGNKIRKELSLGWPYFNPHITIGLANNKNIEQSQYAVKCETRYNDFQQLQFPELAYKYYEKLYK